MERKRGLGTPGLIRIFVVSEVRCEGGREALLKSNEKRVEGKRTDGRTAMIFAPHRRSSATTATARRRPLFPIQWMSIKMLPSSCCVWHYFQ